MERVDQGMALVAARALDGQAPTRELRTRLRTLRAMTHTSGLIATYAYAASKTGDPKKRNDREAAYQRVCDVIRGQAIRSGVNVSEQSKPPDIIKALAELDVAEYARVSASTGLLLSWLARLVDAQQPADDPSQGVAEGGDDAD